MKFFYEDQSDRLVVDCRYPRNINHEMTPDNDGYYPITIFNNLHGINGIKFTMPSVEATVDKINKSKQRVLGEFGEVKISPYTDHLTYQERYRRIEASNICGEYKDFEVKGSFLIAKIKPFGKLIDIIEGPECDLKFTIRSLYKVRVPDNFGESNSIDLTEIIAVDCVDADYFK